MKRKLKYVLKQELDDWPLQTVEFEEFKYDADVREGLKNKELLAKPCFSNHNR